MNNYGVISMGIKLPLVREGDDLEQIIINSLDPSLLNDKEDINEEDLALLIDEDTDSLKKGSKK